MQRQVPFAGLLSKNPSQNPGKLVFLNSSALYFRIGGNFHIGIEIFLQISSTGTKSRYVTVMVHLWLAIPKVN